MPTPDEILAELREWTTKEPSLPGRNPEDEELWLEGFTDARSEIAEIVWRETHA